MKQSFDTDTILCRILNSSPVKDEISGGIYYQDDRPNDSEKEDIVINTVTLSQDFHPQLGESNINVFVPDKLVTINGKQQRKTDRVRLKELSEIITTAIRNANIKGLKAIIKWQTVLAVHEVNQHFSNIRISWNIQID